MKKTKEQTKTAIAVAKDAIAQIKARKCIPKSGTYFRAGNALYRQTGRQLQDVLREVKPKCEVCALGSLFVSIVTLKNAFIVTDGDESGVEPRRMRDRLLECFDRDELCDVENVFEGWLEHDDPGYPNLSALQKLSDRQRLLFIAEQIIAQKGYFDIKKAEAAAKKLLRTKAVKPRKKHN